MDHVDGTGPHLDRLDPGVLFEVRGDREVLVADAALRRDVEAPRHRVDGIGLAERPAAGAEAPRVGRLQAPPRACPPRSSERAGLALRGAGTGRSPRGCRPRARRRTRGASGPRRRRSGASKRDGRPPRSCRAGTGRRLSRWHSTQLRCISRETSRAYVTPLAPWAASASCSTTPGAEVAGTSSFCSVARATSASRRKCSRAAGRAKPIPYWSFTAPR